MKTTLDPKPICLAANAREARGGDGGRVSHERVDRAQFEWFEKLALARKGAAPDEMLRMKYTPTGLLDIAVLESALARIWARQA